MRFVVAILFIFLFKSLLLGQHKTNNKVSTIQLKEANVSSKKLVEKKFGLKKSPGLLHFNEASHNPNDTFEIAQVIKLSNEEAKITSINVYIDGAFNDITFRVRFYGFDGKFPTKSIVNHEIVKTFKATMGWITIDLSEYNIRLKGNIIAALQYIPSRVSENLPVYYNVKIGGSARTFIRSYGGWMSPDSSKSLGQWQIPPAHYRIFVTALVPDNKKNVRIADQDEKDTPPSWKMFSQFLQDSFYVFVKVPKGYNKSKQKRYPTAYLLDGNVYFDHVGSSIHQLKDEKLLPEMILIGIGYKDFMAGDSLRDRDYTSVKALPTDSFKISGGANNFLEFIGKELIPYVDANYKTDTSNRTIMGHSLGGHLVLYALNRALEGKYNFFANFVSASPSLSYHDGYILQQFDSLAATDKKSLKLYISMGSLESEEKSNFSSFLKILTSSKFTQLIEKAETYPNFHHMETAIPSFEKGLLFIHSNQKMKH